MRLGVIGLPGLAEVLAEYGIATIGNPTEHLVSSTLIRQEIGSLDGVIVGTTQVQGLVTWIARRMDRGDRFVHLRLPGAEPLPCLNMDFPCRLNDLLAAFGGSVPVDGQVPVLMLSEGRVLRGFAAAGAGSMPPPPPRMAVPVGDARVSGEVPVVPVSPMPPPPPPSVPQPAVMVPSVPVPPPPPAPAAPPMVPHAIPQAVPQAVPQVAPPMVPQVEPVPAGVGEGDWAGGFDWEGTFGSDDQIAADEGVSELVAETPPVQRADVDDWMDRPSTWASSTSLAASPAGAASRGGRLGEVIFVVARKGGVGKSTWTLSLAERAAANGVPSVAIDMNRGQADLATYMRARRPRRVTNALSIEPFDISNAVVTPAMLAQHRNVDETVHTDVVFGPDASESHPLHVSSSAYRTLIEQARQRYGLVVVDTQTMEAADTSLLIDEVVKPMVGAGEAWALGLVGSSNPSVVNLVRTLQDWNRSGLPSDRVLVMFNQQGGDDAEFDTSQAATLFSGIAEVVGSAAYDLSVVNACNVGVIPSKLPVMAGQLDAVLRRVTGMSVFDAEPVDRRRKRFWQRG